MKRRALIQAMIAAPLMVGMPWSFPNKTSPTRPPQVGKFPKTYQHVKFQCFRKTFGSEKKIYLNGDNITGDCFEFDLVGGWVGVFAPKIVGPTGKMGRVTRWNRQTRRNEVLRVWSFGQVEIK